MSLRGRYIIDRIKKAVSKHLRMPCPPYGDPVYWDRAYMSCEFYEPVNIEKEAAVVYDDDDDDDDLTTPLPRLDSFRFGSVNVRNTNQQ